jgi:trk system potassium uptake protein
VRVDVAASLNLIGALVKYLSLAFLVPIATALVYSEPVWPFLVGALATAGGGAALEAATRGKERVGTREAFLVVSATWLVAALFVSIPYLLSGDPELSSPVDAYFEAMSGMTTTGASILTDIPALNHSMALWRQFSQWIGGMGIIVLALAVLPRLRIGGRQLLASEAPGHEFQNITASIRDTARRLWVVYVGLTALPVLVLAAVGWSGLDRQMNLYEAVAHAFTTMPTGGFSTRGRSIEEFGAATQWTIIVFIVLAGTNFALMYAMLRRRANPTRDDEFRLYVALIALATALLFAELAGKDVVETGEDGVRTAMFQAVSLMTTTGYASADFAAWTGPATMILLLLMFVGGSALSTAGSVKVVRHLVVGRVVRRELDQVVHPEALNPLRFNGRVVDERIVRSVGLFVLLYVGLFGLGTLLIELDSARVGLELSPFEAASAVATTVGNVGPGFGFLGPMGSFDPFSDVSKGILIVLMWMGRLELIPVLVLFTRGYWRR